MECVRSKKEAERALQLEAMRKASLEKKERKARYSGMLIADLGHKVIGCTVRWPKIKCFKCDGEEGERSRLYSLFRIFALYIFFSPTYIIFMQKNAFLHQYLENSNTLIGLLVRAAMNPTI